MSVDARLLELLQAALRDGWWIPIDAYLRDYEDTREAVYSRRSKGIWQDGIHSKFVQGGGLWINLPEVRKWGAKKCPPPCPVAPPPPPVPEEPDVSRLMLLVNDGVPTCLYRHFDGAGALLYVGISLRPFGRLRTHARGSHWSRTIVRVELQWFASRKEALIAEARAIHGENPIHNITRNRR